MIVGVAGHIDHGKTALVRALTGIDADRLPEEKQRGISIDIGFAYLDRPDGGVMGFVDMPGHEKFMRNMLAGAAGIDLLLLVVAADDGVMPQTQEHLAVAELLGVSRAMVAIAKCDLVDEARLAIARAEVRRLLAGSALADAPLVNISTRTGRGLGMVQTLLDQAAAHEAPARDGPARFAVDRSFSLAGAGTIVTGVVVQGTIGVGDTLVISPSGRDIRVRSLHVQNRPGEIARSGERCGLALGGRTPVDAVVRGDWLVDPVLHAPTGRIDGIFRLLASEERPLRHWTPVRFHHGAAEIAARAALLQDTPIEPGEEGLIQLVLEEPVAAAVCDRFVIRAANGERTLGGGRIVDLRPPQRRRKQPRRLEQIAAMALPDAGASLAAQLARWPWYVECGTFQRDHALAVLPTVQAKASGRFLFDEDVWARLGSSARNTVAAFHARHPRLLGPSAKRIGEALEPPLPHAVASALLDGLANEGALVREGGAYRLPAHRLGLDRSDEQLWQRAAPLLGGEVRFRPPLLPELAPVLAAREFDLARVLRAKVQEGALAEVAEGRFLLAEALREIAAILAELAEEGENGAFGAADLRDRLGNGRKVAIQILEYFDRQQVTARRGEMRVLDPFRLARYRERGRPGV